MARWRTKWPGLVLVGCAALGIAAAAARAQTIAEWAEVANLGASFSVYSYGQASYNRSAPFLRLEERQRFSDGANAFRLAPGLNDAILSAAVRTASANAPSCESCHLKNGRGRTHSTDFTLTGFSVVNLGHEKSPRIFRTPARSDVGAARLTNVRWAVVERITLSAGETIELVRPVAIVDSVERPVDLRNASGVYGLGLLESIPDSDIIASAKAQAFERFGIAGRVPVASGPGASMRVGRFGWKGSFATLPDQVTNALKAELGMADPGHHRKSVPRDRAFKTLVTDLTGYLRLLAVPARRLNADEGYRRGAKHFEESGCAMCHTPSWRTGRTAPELGEKYQNLTIFPFTDMLLHDMGSGLSDLSTDELNRHWRTPPLWGIGVQHAISPEVGFLHDGRARTWAEAILWHGGESRYAVDRFKAMTPQERSDLLAFLSSL